MECKSVLSKEFINQLGEYTEDFLVKISLPNAAGHYLYNYCPSPSILIKLISSYYNSPYVIFDIQPTPEIIKNSKCVVQDVIDIVKVKPSKLPEQVYGTYKLKHFYKEPLFMDYPETVLHAMYEDSYEDVNLLIVKVPTEYKIKGKVPDAQGGIQGGAY